MRTRIATPLLLTFFIGFLTTNSNAQIRRPNHNLIEIGGFVGAANYAGDLAEPHYVGAQTRAAAGIFFRHYTTRLVHLRVQASTATLYGDDKYGDRTHFLRNFKFRNQVYELAGLVEYTPWDHIHYDLSKAQTTLHFFPYLFGGASVVVGEPKVEHYGPAEEFPKYVKEPLPEGGDGLQNYFALPFGMGVQVMIGNRFSLGVEACTRPVFSDTLDGVSQNGTPDNQDWFSTLTLTASYCLNKAWAESY